MMTRCVRGPPTATPHPPRIGTTATATPSLVKQKPRATPRRGVARLALVGALAMRATAIQTAEWLSTVTFRVNQHNSPKMGSFHLFVPPKWSIITFGKTHF